MNIYREKGFTLVELAIVMTIIGLLTGGILKAQAMINNARITTTIAQVDSYKAALTMFRDKYGQLPGDMSLATTKLPNCNAANSCSNGDGNSEIGVPYIIWNSVDSAIDSENVQFWKHLAMSDLITGINISSGAREWGATHPVSKFDGGFHAMYAGPRYTPRHDNQGTMVVMKSSIAGTTRYSTRGAISAKHAGKIDRKMDDGKPFSGHMISISSLWSQGCNWDYADTSWYDETVDQKNCESHFKLGL